jgi:hypothetical protein
LTPRIPIGRLENLTLPELDVPADINRLSPVTGHTPAPDKSTFRDAP